MLALERRCLALLQQHGQQPDYQLLGLLRERGMGCMPPFLADAGEDDAAAVRRFVENRAHLFEVVRGDELRPTACEWRRAEGLCVRGPLRVSSAGRGWAIGSALALATFFQPLCTHPAANPLCSPLPGCSLLRLHSPQAAAAGRTVRSAPAACARQVC